MDINHPIKKSHEPIPHDPRNEPIPEREEDGRTPEDAEKEAREEEGVRMRDQDDPDGSPSNRVAQPGIDPKL